MAHFTFLSTLVTCVHFPEFNPATKKEWIGGYWCLSFVKTTSFVFFLSLGSLVQINTHLSKIGSKQLSWNAGYTCKLTYWCLLVLPLATLTKKIPVTQCANVYWVEPVTGTVYSEGKSKEAVISISGLLFPVSRLTAFMHTIKQEASTHRSRMGHKVRYCDFANSPIPMSTLTDSEERSQYVHRGSGLSHCQIVKCLRAELGFSFTWGIYPQFIVLWH